jgi:peroxiredoxin Q/BCP
VTTAITWLLAATVIGLPVLAGETNPPPAVGSSAPRVAGKDQDGKAWKLADWLGKKMVLLYFYPKDETPGCTAEACSWRDRTGDLQRDNVQVVGVSFDSGESHLRFITRHSLNFPLIADTDGRMADAYGVRQAGKNLSRRVSFLIGLDGKIAHITDSPKAEVHVTEMTQAIARLVKK